MKGKQNSIDKESIKQMIRQDKENKERIIKERWKNLKKFETVQDVPSLPIPLTQFYVKKLIEAGAIPKDKLIDGKMYIGNCRNADHAIWDAKRNVFVYKRNKFGYLYDEDINHFEDDNGYDLFVPIKELS